MHFYHPRLKQACEREVKRCNSCQRYKLVGRGHHEVSLLPGRTIVEGFFPALQGSPHCLIELVLCLRGQR